VKTFEEQGFQIGLTRNNWYGFFVSSKTSADTIKALNKAIQQAVADPVANAKMTQSGAEPEINHARGVGRHVEIRH
jgi:tripartite-type tricarboxylate transporter receptor subunit TctC